MSVGLEWQGMITPEGCIGESQLAEAGHNRRIDATAKTKDQPFCSSRLDIFS